MTAKNYKGSTIYEVVSYSYQDLKMIAMREWKKFHPKKPFEGDLFHDTILKICQRLDNAIVTTKYVLSYFCNAFRNNLIRDTLYAHNRYGDSTDVETIKKQTQEINMATKLDFQTMVDDITSRFGKQAANEFIMFTEGYTLREINEKDNITNADYIVRKVKNYVKENYTDKI